MLMVVVKLCEKVEEAKEKEEFRKKNVAQENLIKSLLQTLTLNFKIQKRNSDSDVV